MCANSPRARDSGESHTWQSNNCAAVTVAPRSVTKGKGERKGGLRRRLPRSWPSWARGTQIGLPVYGCWCVAGEGGDESGGGAPNCCVTPPPSIYLRRQKSGGVVRSNCAAHAGTRSNATGRWQGKREGVIVGPDGLTV